MTDIRWCHCTDEVECIPCATSRVRAARQHWQAVKRAIGVGVLVVAVFAGVLAAVALSGCTVVFRVGERTTHNHAEPAEKGEDKP